VPVVNPGSAGERATSAPAGNWAAPCSTR